MEDKIVKFIEIIVPTWPCNFRCHYCYVGQHADVTQRNRMEPFQHTPEEFKKALSVTRLGGKCIINFCANGETLLVPQNIRYIKAMLQAGHFVIVVSNMTVTKAIDELLLLPEESLSRLFFKASFHWLELKRLNLLDTFTQNVKKVWEKNASATVEITPSDELEFYIPQIKEYALKHFGALPHITIPRDENDDYKILTKNSPEEFAKIWGTFDSDLFRFKMSVWGKKIKKFCYAGVYAYSINLASGDIYRCSSCGLIGNLFAHPERPLPENPAGTHCPFPHCFNAHAWLAFGLTECPGLPPSHKALRDRICKDGFHWLNPRMAQAFSFRSIQVNPVYGFWRKLQATCFYHRGRHSLWWHLRHWKF